ncbi:aminotransferase class I/II-fold pyridoxal phosphate-dependent enzyme, partial [Escherichia coli]|nr:aminotransferase class I/II-fold pyridoxal phosphate-dependent enzyme [Escherichia coli]
MHLENTIKEIRQAGLYKSERVLEGPQDAHIEVNGREVLNMCANNYLGLSDHPAVVKAAHDGLEKWGFGLSSVRFICGTQTIHKELERKISEFL